ncbi:MAG TPA: nucleoside-diphosphate sugar epimerase/dehydratase [Polyangiaceae bacterium]|jgi:FlaA1/EpsC-like NDP-sugar epimerase
MRATSTRLKTGPIAIEPAAISSMWRRVIVVLAHILVWTLAYFAAYFLRFDGSVPEHLLRAAYIGFVVLLGVKGAVFWVSGLFHGLMRYAGIPEIKAILRASTIATCVFIGAGVVISDVRVPRSIYVGEWLLSILFASSLRLCVRVLKERRRVHGSDLKRAILIGAGDTGEMFLRDLERVSNPGLRVVSLFDDDPGKHGGSVRGLRVMGVPGERELRRARDEGARLAVLALPGASGVRTREIVAACHAAGLETKTLPGLSQIVSGDVKVSMLRDVAIEDLLRREPVELDAKSMAELLKGRRILVTGGAGSIGSELARQALRFSPSSVALLDHNENGLFYLEQELRQLRPGLDLRTMVGDIKDARRVSEVLRAHRPHVVLHAAAHKHVPLMEANPAEAIKNNVFGTKVVADLAGAFGVETFVLISTDKAVNPTSVMGASKRLAEMYLQSLSNRNRTRYVAVRFGNVLGSSGSVVKVFRKQIERGGPVTVTHPEMRRYFMTIPEACQLVLQAGALARGGEIFILDMGEPVKIVDLARDMIKMSGYEPDKDIKLEFVGQRPGEKLYEELLLDGEDHDRTKHPKIVVAKVPPIEGAVMAQAVGALAEALDGTADELRQVIASLLPAEAHFSSLPPPETSEDVDKALEGLERLETLGVRSAVAS